MTAYPTLTQPLELKWTAALRVGHQPRRNPGTLRLVHLRARLPVDCLEPTSEALVQLEVRYGPRDLWLVVPSQCRLNDFETCCWDSLDTVLNRARGAVQVSLEAQQCPKGVLRMVAERYTQEQVARYDDWQAERSREDRADRLADDAHDAARDDHHA